MAIRSLYAKLLKGVIGISLLSWLAVIILSRAETAHEVEELFDAQLAQQAGIIFEVSKKALEQQILLNTILQKTTYGHKYEYKISFQIWQNNQLLFQTQNSPLTQLSYQTGYSDQYFNDEKWRVFTTHEKIGSSRYTIIAATEYDIRDELIEDLVYEATSPLLIGFPILILLMHLAIKKGLKPLQHIAHLVAEKDTMDFSPLHLNETPKELQAIIASLNKLMQRLKIAFDKERRFTMHAAHELRTPIAALQIQAQVAKHSIDNPEQLNTALDNILKGTKKSTHLVSQMLTLARLEPEAIKGRFALENLTNTIRDCISEQVPFALEKQIEMSFSPPNDETKQCYIDSQGISIMMNNLIQNAIRYTPKQGTIHIALKYEQEHTTIYVRDSGPGIEKSEIPKVMERYYRISQQNQLGCGLGLSIVKQIVDIHSGNIQLSNDDGLVVCITLPCAALNS